MSGVLPHSRRSDPSKRLSISGHEWSLAFRCARKLLPQRHSMRMAWVSVKLTTMLASIFRPELRSNISLTAFAPYYFKSFSVKKSLIPRLTPSASKYGSKFVPLTSTAFACGSAAAVFWCPIYNTSSGEQISNVGHLMP